MACFGDSPEVEQMMIIQFHDLMFFISEQLGLYKLFFVLMH